MDGRFTWLPALAIALGLIVRLASLTLPGTSDMIDWKVWSYAAATDGPSRIYGVTFPPLRHVIGFGELRSVANYPPLAIDELAAIGRAHAFIHGGAFPDDASLRAIIRTAITGADVLCAIVLWLALRRIADRATGWRAVAAFWANPAILLAHALGYIDSFFVLPALGALVAASAGRPVLAGGLVAAAVMTKPQALFEVPVLALLLHNRERGGAAWYGVALAAAAGVVVAAALTVPVVVSDATFNMLRAVTSMTRQDILSGNACNLWWIAGAALQRPAEVIPLSRVAELGYPSPRIIGGVLTLGAITWAIWIARHVRSVGLAAAVAAFCVHAYVVLAPQVHENHLIVAVPLLVIAAALDRRFSPMLWAVSAILTMNLYLFYGVTGEGPPAIARSLTGIDTTIVVALANCVLLVWFARILRRALNSRSS